MGKLPIPARKFEEMNADEVASMVEEDIRELARQWRGQRVYVATSAQKAAATETAACVRTTARDAKRREGVK